MLASRHSGESRDPERRTGWVSPLAGEMSAGHKGARIITDAKKVCNSPNPEA